MIKSLATMIKKLALLVLVVFLAGTQAYSQCCTYTLQTADSWGDGWNGGTMDISINGTSIGTYAAAGTGTNFNFTVCDGDALVLTYSSGSFESENTYTLVNHQGATISSGGPNIPVGTVYSGTGACGDCYDGIQNGDETGVDCGGTFCTPCTCYNGVQDGSETGVDCGPVCGVPCPCSITATASPATLPCGGGTVTVTGDATGGTTYALDNDFDGGVAGTGWNVSPAGQFDNPCDPSVDGGTYMWMGATTAAPRTLETAPLDVSCGGDICFYLDFSTQGGASPCEGPDLTNEGVYLEYSIDGGATWVTINYFEPDAGGTTGPYLSWAQYCFPIPPAAETANTLFHWFQSGSSGTCCDHWGIDNVTITSQDCNSYDYFWPSVPPGTINVNDSTVTATITTTSDFTVCYTNHVDDTCCTTITVTVGSLNPLVVNGTDEVCIGDNDGTITIDPATGGTAPYTYEIDDGAGGVYTQVGSGAFTGLPPGTYTVTVTDAAGCQSFGSWTVNPGVSCCPMTNTEAFTDVSCFGANDGTITLTETNGAAPVTFSIDGGTTSQGTGNFTGLGPGTYNILITDNNGCTYTSTITIAEPAQIIINDVVTDATCGLTNGEITLNASGGSGAGYQYSIDNGATFQGSGTFTGLGAGNYNVVVMDGAGCTEAMVVTVNNGGAPSIDAVVTADPSCDGACDGTIDITASGGSGALQYSIDNGTTFQATGNFAGLCDGTYDIVVEDALGCPAIASATLNQPAPINFTVNVTDLLCESVCQGELDIVAVSGGDGNYQYSVDNGTTFQPGGTFAALCAGTYDVIVEDGNGCQGTATSVIAEPAPLNMALTQTDPLCAGGCDGTIDLFTTGGTGTITYSIDNGTTTVTTPLFTGLCAGTYDCVVEDDNGCKLFATVTLTDPVPVSFTSAVVDATCGAANGTIDITAAGGDGNYSYSFDNGANYGPSNQLTGATAGTYDVIVQDGNGCADTNVVVLNNAGAPTVDSIQITDPTCAGSCDGSIVVFASGGSGAIQFSIDGGGTFQASNVFNALCAGTINVTIEDGNGCQASSSATLTDPAPVTYNVTTVDLDCFNQCIGEINITGVTGGAGGYTFSDDNGANFQTDSSFTALCAGNYNVVVQDASGCTATSTETITEPVQLTYTAVETPNSCNSANGPCDGTLTITENGGTGTMQYSVDNGGTFQASNVFTGLCAGNYDVVVMDANGCTAIGVETVTEPTALSFTTVIQTTSCGTNNGSVTVTAAGGSSGTYEYSIDNGVTYGASNFFDLLPAGAYDICIRDGNGCVYCEVVNVNNDPAQIITSLNTTPETCFGSCDGTIDVQLTGGTPAFQYGIDGGALQASNIFTGVCAGTHNIETVDANGCVVFGSVAVGGPAAMAFTTNLTDVTCFGACNGAIDFASTSGGDGVYQYSIDNGATFSATTNFTGLCAGTYDLVVTDGNGCTATGTVVINEPTALTMTFTTTDAVCSGYCDGTADAVIGGGTFPYDYAWSTGAPTTSTSIAGLCAGTYDLVVTDANGCVIDTIGFAINEPAPFVITGVAIQDELCTGDCQGTVTVTAPGADQFTIDGGLTFQTSGTFNGLCAGTYTVQAQDAAGCLTDTTITVGQPTPLSIAPGNDTTICVGGTANIQAYGSGGTLPYTYDWGTAGTGSPLAVSPVTTTDYTVFITDGNGCTTTDEMVTVTVLPPLAGLSYSNQSICPGDTAVLQADGNGGDGNIVFTWTNDQDATVLMGNYHLVSPPVTTNYVVELSDGCETPNVFLDTVTITVLPQPDLLMSADSYDGCTPLTVNFSNDTDPVMVSACSWEFGDGSSSTDCNPTHTYTVPGCYDVVMKVVSPDGCSSDTVLTSYICVWDVPVPDFTFGPQPTTIVNTEISFNNTSINASSYDWDFGYGGQTSTDIHPVHVFPDSVPGSYEVCLTAINGSGCMDSVCQTVIIDDEFLLYVPNAFTPDGDGVNDVFLPRLNGYDVTSFNMLIFDRWGEEIFQSSFPDVGWDGSAKGGTEIAQTDVYVWLIRVKDATTNREKIYKGHVTLLK